MLFEHTLAAHTATHPLHIHTNSHRHTVRYTRTQSNSGCTGAEDAERRRLQFGGVCVFEFAASHRRRCRRCAALAVTLTCSDVALLPLAAYCSRHRSIHLHTRTHICY